MAIRLPLTTLLDYNQTAENGAGVAGVNASVVGGQALAFLIPQDCDNIIVKFSASVVGGGGASATFQTSDDGGSTWFDVQRSSVVSNANASVTPEWLSIPVISPGVRSIPSVVAVGSIQTMNQTIGSSGASTLGVREVSGLPILGRNARVFIRYTGTVTSITAMRVTASANNQSSSTP